VQALWELVSFSRRRYSARYSEMLCPILPQSFSDGIINAAADMVASVDPSAIVPSAVVSSLFKCPRK